MQNQVVADCAYKDPEINVSFFGLNSAGFSDYPTINSDSDIGGLESYCE